MGAGYQGDIGAGCTDHTATSKGAWPTGRSIHQGGTTMNHSTHARRSSAAVAITALAGLFAIAPAYAADDPGELTPADVRVYEAGGNIGVSGSPSPGTVQILPVDDNALEFLQIGLGALGGMAVVAAGVAAASTVRQHGQAHPA